MPGCTSARLWCSLNGRSSTEHQLHERIDRHADPYAEANTGSDEGRVINDAGNLGVAGAREPGAHREHQQGHQNPHRSGNLHRRGGIELAWIPAGHILRMSPPLIMDEHYAEMGLSIIEESIAEELQQYGQDAG